MPDVLIFDDDAAIGGLLTDILHRHRLTVDYYGSGAGVVQMVLDARPRLLILDVMMPGMDGLSACRAIRNNPATRHVKIIILTAKNFEQDKNAAKRFGADAFVGKPFAVEAFGRIVESLLGQGPMEADPAAPPAPPVAISVAPGAAVLEAENLTVVFDAGKGLSEGLARRKQAPRDCWLLLSRYQEDALSEIGALGGFLAAGCRVKIGGPDDPESSLQRLAPRLSRQPGARVSPFLYPQREGEFQLAPGVQGRAQYTQHPGPTLAYQVLIGGKKIVWCPAHEINPDPKFWRGHEMEKFRNFFGHADLLLHGYSRSSDDAAPGDGLGRGAWEPVVDLAAECQVKRLALIPLPAALPVLGGLPARLEERRRVQELVMEACACRGGESFIL